MAGTYAKSIKMHLLVNNKHAVTVQHPTLTEQRFYLPKPAADRRLSTCSGQSESAITNSGNMTILDITD